jgi:hypothetical protein
MSTPSLAQTVPVAFDPLREVAFGSITASFATVGPATTFPTRIIHVGNTTNTDLDVSIDGTNIHIRLPPGSFTLYDISATHGNATISGLPSQISIYVRYKSGSSAPTSGYFYCTIVRGKF